MPTISAMAALDVTPCAISTAISFAVGVPSVFLAISTGLVLQFSQAFDIVSSLHLLRAAYDLPVGRLFLFLLVNLLGCVPGPDHVLDVGAGVNSIEPGDVGQGRRRALAHISRQHRAALRPFSPQLRDALRSVLVVASHVASK